MTIFIDVPTICQIVERVGLVEFIKGMTDTIKDNFRHWESFDKCARVAAHSDIGVIELMPVVNKEKYAFKYVNGHPANTSKGLPTVMAFGALADVETGFPQLIAELTLTTAFRTAATSAMAAKALARADSKVMAMIGCGAQSEFQAIAFHTLVGIDIIQIFDIDEKAMQKLQRNLQNFPSLEVILVQSAIQATQGADIVTTCTADKTWATILTPEMVSAGMHINAIGGDCPGKTELHVDLLLNAKIFVEYEPQSRIEGDIQQLPESHPVHDLWRVIAEKEIGRDNEQQITIFDSVGFAIEDFSALQYMQVLAEQFAMGEKIALTPELNDPKDLFSKLLDSNIADCAAKAS